jgi:DNA-binding winged helix-turn-helix (wHTH) protein
VVVTNISTSRIHLPRPSEQAALFAGVRDMHPVSVVGVSNTGKSTLLRSLVDPAVQADNLGESAAGYLFVYVDFNQMLATGEQGFYELVLRCARDRIRHLPGADDVRRQVEEAYTALLAPASPFNVALSFSEALAAIGDLLPQRVVFLFDEIDGPIAEIEGRVFLNLRALKDRHPDGFTYITATNCRLGQICSDGDVSEFAELFAYHTHYLSLFSNDEIAQYVAQFAESEGIGFSAEDVDFVRTWAGGHPGLLESVCRVLGLISGRPMRDATQNWVIHRRTAEILARDINIQAECSNIWNDLTSAEQEALWCSFHSPEQAEPPELESVMAKHLVTEDGSGCQLFCRAFSEFVQRQRSAHRPSSSGLELNTDSGEVWVDGVLLPTLTNLEYRLLMLLYGRVGKICTKYDVVEAVWGEDYIDEVDDARIEKLVSRLRHKLEDDPLNPKYLVTVRGRGYRLSSP